MYCVICSKYRTFEKPKISHLIEKTQVLSFYYKFKIEGEKMLKEEDWIKILKILGLINNIEYQNRVSEYIKSCLKKTWIINLD